MAVLLETSKGDITIDLYIEETPKASTNFLKYEQLLSGSIVSPLLSDVFLSKGIWACRLCKTKYYNNCLFFNVQNNFIAQTGDPTNSGKGGNSVYGLLYGDQARFFEDEIRPTLKHKKKGLVGMAS